MHGYKDCLSVHHFGPHWHFYRHSHIISDIFISFPGHLIFIRVLHNLFIFGHNSLFPLVLFVSLSLCSCPFSGLCGVIEQKDEGGQQPDSACGAQTQPGHAGLCEYDGFISIICSYLQPKQHVTNATVCGLGPWVFYNVFHLFVWLDTKFIRSYI